MSWQSRRLFLLSGTSASLFGLQASAQQSDWGRMFEDSFDETQTGIDAAEDVLAALERQFNGRFGVSAVNLATGYTLTHRGDERFAMCSTFKWMLAALILKEVELGKLSLEQAVRFTAADMVPYAPVTEKALDRGSLTIAELCEGTVQLSDNPAANLLLELIGGPDGFTSRLREDGEVVTRLDRWEPELNENADGDVRDTTSPNAMVSLMGFYIFGAGLEPASRQQLRDWMIGTSTGLNKLRKGIPSDWVAGDKTGTATNDQSNDVAFAYRAEDPENPILIASYLNVPEPMSDEVSLLHARIGDMVMDALA